MPPAGPCSASDRAFGQLRIHHLAEVGSTNDWIAEAARRGDSDGTWVRADRQTGGRGRRGRAWVSDPGNLFASALIRPAAGETPPHLFSFVAALALHDMASHFAPAERLSLKWPNDLLLDGVKVAGLLVEGAGDAIILGCGVNLSHHPPATERPATSFPAAGLVAPDPSAAVSRLADAVAARRQEWRNKGFGALRTAWLDRTAHRLGDPLEARLGRETLGGHYAGLAEDGALRLTLADGTERAIHGGEVFTL